MNKDELMIKQLRDRENIHIELSDLKISLYNQWHDLKDTFGIDSLVGIMEFIENHARVKELRQLLKKD